MSVGTHSSWTTSSFFKNPFLCAKWSGMASDVSPGNPGDLLAAAPTNAEQPSEASGARAESSTLSPLQTLQTDLPTMDCIPSSPVSPAPCELRDKQEATRPIPLHRRHQPVREVERERALCSGEKRCFNFAFLDSINSDLVELNIPYRFIERDSDNKIEFVTWISSTGKCCDNNKECNRKQRKKQQPSQRQVLNQLDHHFGGAHDAAETTTTSDDEERRTKHRVKCVLNRTCKILESHRCITRASLAHWECDIAKVVFSKMWWLEHFRFVGRDIPSTTVLPAAVWGVALKSCHIEVPRAEVIHDIFPSCIMATETLNLIFTDDGIDRPQFFTLQNAHAKTVLLRTMLYTEAILRGNSYARHLTVIIPKLVRCCAGNSVDQYWGDENCWSENCKVIFILETVYCYEDVLSFMRTFHCQPDTWFEVSVLSVISEAPFQYYHEMKRGSEMAIVMDRCGVQNLALSAFGFTSVVVNNDVNLGFRLRRLTVVTDSPEELACFDNNFQFAKNNGNTRPQNLTRFVTNENLVDVSLEMTSEDVGHLRAEYALTTELCVVYAGSCRIAGREEDDLKCEPVARNVRAVAFEGLRPQCQRRQSSQDSSVCVSRDSEMVAFRLLLNFVTAPMSRVGVLYLSNLSVDMIDVLFKEMAHNTTVRRLYAKMYLDGNASNSNFDCFRTFLERNRCVTAVDGISIDRKSDQTSLAQTIFKHNRTIRSFELDTVKQTPVFLRAITRNDYFANRVADIVIRGQLHDTETVEYVMLRSTEDFDKVAYDVMLREQEVFRRNRDTFLDDKQRKAQGNEYFKQYMSAYPMAQTCQYLSNQIIYQSNKKKARMMCN